jgi:hypothetical protein
MQMVNIYTPCIRNPYICFDKPLSTSGGSSKGVHEFRIHLHVENTTNYRPKTYKFIVIIYKIRC